MEVKDSTYLKQLVEGLVLGDEACFKNLYELFSVKVYNITRKMGLGHEDAEGVVQEVFLKIWKNRAKLDPELSINAYIFAILRSRVINQLKKQARFFAFQEYQIPLLQQVTNFSADSDLIYAEFHNLSLELIEKLPPAQRQIFKLRHLENKSVAEISEALNLSRRTVENHIFRSTKLFKEGLDKLEIVSKSVWIIALNEVIDLFLTG
ncbi:sigma-70 family RNA polymerase sigma factor [Algoriphagus sp. AGSA1]|uniref:RNA polymerase sigma factor n=1 Tax=unclassified Algoriphagus TaxID=2641541 RepID=UPI00177B1BB6|nr:MULTISPECIES: sigma-70 family RNA polymerase sigma factor [unclassified Algoriphagus]MCE7056249.1 sigma-70 family RNA polymerase sigma factor [Algoriphagus sp. AGSA1]